MTARILIAALLLGLAWPRQAAAQAARTGLEVALDLMDRVVRVVGRQPPGQRGEIGYGLVVGEQPDGDGRTLLVIIVPDHIVRDPAAPDARPPPPSVTMRADATNSLRAQLLNDRLPPDQGGIAVITVAKPASQRTPVAVMAETAAILPATPVWQIGRSGNWAPANSPGQFALQDRAGWMLFEGIDNSLPGGTVVGDQGIVGIIIGPHGDNKELTRVLSINYLALRIRAWGLAWDIQAAGTPALGDRAAPRPASPRAQAPITLAPIQIVPLLPAEVAARASWTPPRARLTPWSDSHARLFSAPRREAAVVGILPASRAFNPDIRADGAYDILAKLDNGAWFLVGTGGQPLGYVAGSEVVEIWPMPAVAGMAGGKVVREWTAAGGRPALLRDVGTSYEVETAAECRLAICQSVIAFTPIPPTKGAISPTFQTPVLRGTWRQGDIVTLRLQLPRRLIETTGVKLLACIGSENDCPMDMLYPPPTK